MSRTIDFACLKRHLRRCAGVRAVEIGLDCSDCCRLDHGDCDRSLKVGRGRYDHQKRTETSFGGDCLDP